MSLVALLFLVVIVGLVALVCVPLDGSVAKITRITVLVCTVLWVIVQATGGLSIGR